MDFIPVIDLAGIADKEIGKIKDSNSACYLLSISDDDYPLWNNIATEIRNALSGIGFMYLKNHGISQEVISSAFTASAQFFSLPEEIKSKYKKNPDVSSHGWVQPGQELLHPDSVFELRECFDVAGNERFYPTPEEHPNFRREMEKLENEGKVLMRKLLKLLGLSLELEDTDYFIKCCRHLDSNDSWISSGVSGGGANDDDSQNPAVKNECDLRAIYYPAIPDNLKVPPGTVRCAAHTDYEIITLLFQDNVGGLEVKDVNGKWIPATPIPNTILVNTGDLLQFWTSGYYPATLHRVIIPEKEIQQRIARYSFAYFFAPDDNTSIMTLKSPHVPAVAGRDNGNDKNAIEANPPITAYQHITNRMKSSFQY